MWDRCPLTQKGAEVGCDELPIILKAFLSPGQALSASDLMHRSSQLTTSMILPVSSSSCPRDGLPATTSATANVGIEHHKLCMPAFPSEFCPFPRS